MLFRWKPSSAPPHPLQWNFRILKFSLLHFHFIGFPPFFLSLKTLVFQIPSSRIESRNPNHNPTTVPPLPFQFAYSSTADDHSSHKVKLLCSFGGNILPRPSDDALWYAVGQTRIIAAGRDTSLPEIYRKMIHSYGGPVVIRYQLPDEDLDALVIVSSAEDLDNMMDEYEKLMDQRSSASSSSLLPRSTTPWPRSFRLE